MLQHAVLHCLPWIGCAVFVTWTCQMSLSIILIPKLASVPRALTAIAFALNFISHIWLWQYWFRPDWNSRGILFMVIVNLGVSVLGYLSLRRPAPDAENIAKATLVATGVDLTLQASLVACMLLLSARTYEPLIKSPTARSCWMSSSQRVPAQSTACDQPLCHPGGPLSLESLHQAHEYFREEPVSKLSASFAPVRHLSCERKSMYPRCSNNRNSTPSLPAVPSFVPSSVTGSILNFGSIWTYCFLF